GGLRTRSVISWTICGLDVPAATAAAPAPRNTVPAAASRRGGPSAPAAPAAPSPRGRTGPRSRRPGRGPGPARTTVRPARPFLPPHGQRLHVGAEGRHDVGVREHRVDGVLEGAEVFLPVPALAQLLQLLGQELRRDAGALVGGDLHPLPGTLALP